MGFIAMTFGGKAVGAVIDIMPCPALIAEDCIGYCVMGMAGTMGAAIRDADMAPFDIAMGLICVRGWLSIGIIPMTAVGADVRSCLQGVALGSASFRGDSSFSGPADAWCWHGALMTSSDRCS